MPIFLWSFWNRWRKSSLKGKTTYNSFLARKKITDNNQQRINPVQSNLWIHICLLIKCFFRINYNHYCLYCVSSVVAVCQQHHIFGRCEGKPIGFSNLLLLLFSIKISFSIEIWNCGWKHWHFNGIANAIHWTWDKWRNQNW